MSEDLMRYDVLAQNALKGVVREALKRAESEGLPGNHHFYIAFKTGAPGVMMSETLRDQYPEDMTIVLEHQFWNLKVEEDRFSVELSFNQKPELLVIPFSAVVSFFDPEVQFGLQFQPHPDDLPEEADALLNDAEENAAPESDEQKSEAMGEVVSLDQFRNKK